MHHDVSVLSFIFTAFAIAFFAQVLAAKTRSPRTMSIFIALSAVIALVQFRPVPEAAHSDWIVETCLGLILLATGIELSFDKVKEQWKAIVIGGSFYTVLTGILAGVAYYFSFSPSIVSSFFIGAVVAMSSTLLVHERLEETRVLHTGKGSFCVGILLSQDMLLLPLILLTYWIKRKDGQTGIFIDSDFLLFMFLGIVVLAVLLIVEMTVAKKFFKMVEGNGEHDRYRYYGAIGFVVSGTCLLATKLAGLSVPLGMFIAGLIISRTDKKERVVNLCHTLTSLALPVLIVTLGARLDYGLLKSEWKTVIGCVVSILVVKSFGGLIVAKCFGYSYRTAIRIGAVLCPLGATATELAYEAFNNGHISKLDFELTNFIVVFSMLTFPFVMMISIWLSKNLKAHTHEHH